MKIREAVIEDFDQAIRLYKELSGDRIASGDDAKQLWTKILKHEGTTVLAAENGIEIVGLVTLHLMPNLTFGERPYALIENVITTSNLQGQGIGRQIMQAAIDLARSQNAYKVMLLTGQGRGAKGFYEKLGFNAEDKHGMIIWNK